jgi:hypothetical protein
LNDLSVSGSTKNRHPKNPKSASDDLSVPALTENHHPKNPMSVSSDLSVPALTENHRPMDLFSFRSVFLAEVSPETHHPKDRTCALTAISVSVSTENHPHLKNLLSLCPSSLAHISLDDHLHPMNRISASNDLSVQNHPTTARPGPHCPRAKPRRLTA